MATQKPISTISYNTRAFLLEKLNTWYDAHIIQAWQVIFHKGEDGDKDHAHVRVEPNKRIDPMELADALKEYVKDNEKPLGVRPFRPSREEDWFLYAVHDPEYMRLKYADDKGGEKIPYSWQDILASPDYDVETAFIRAKSYLNHSSANIASRLRQGASSLDLMEQGENPFIVNAICRAVVSSDYDALMRSYRALKADHDKLYSQLSGAGFQLDNHERLVFISESGEVFSLDDVQRLLNEV